MIEKNIFQSWFTKNLNPIIENKINYFKNMNPEYKYNLYTDDEIDLFVNENYKGEIAECYNKINIIVAKVDFWRYLVLYKYGGVYLDMDSSIEYPLKELIKDDDQAIITAEGNPNMYVQWALIFAKEHPILKKTIELIVDNIKNNRFPNDIHKMTGPSVYTKAINEIHKQFFNKIINHKIINHNTDITFKTNSHTLSLNTVSNTVSYRIFGIDYNKFFCFKYNESFMLFINKKHWKIEEKEKLLLKK